MGETALLLRFIYLQYQFALEKRLTNKKHKFFSDALNYECIRVDMKYLSVVSCRDGMLLKRHWFDKPNKCWWALIINGGIDDSVWWPWALSYSMGLEWIMNEEFPDWSVRLSLQTLDWHFNGAPARKTTHQQRNCHCCPAGLVASLLPNKAKDMVWINTSPLMIKKWLLNKWMSMATINAISKCERPKSTGRSKNG